jgi:5-(carboxyamino)imidazole ribonucleotide mutase
MHSPPDAPVLVALLRHRLVAPDVAPAVVILMGSKSDLAVGNKCADVLDALGVSWEMHVASAHRTPDDVEHHVRKSGADVFVGIAGVAAALPGVIAALTTKPVIGVPVGGKVPFDSLLSMVQMPPGVPVATVGVDRGENAGFLAAQILALHDAKLAKRLAAQREEAAAKVRADDASIQGGGA